MRAIDPIFVTPRLVQRDWGRADLGDWIRTSRDMCENVAEAWLIDPANATDAGPLGRRIARQTSGVMGDLGRAPPKIRLVFPGRRASIKSTSPVSLWTVLEPGVGAISGHEGVVHRTGERIRAYEGAEVLLADGCVALEVSAAFQPNNETDNEPQIIRLPPVSSRARATLFRETGLSVESWTLPEWSRIVPDGETCHALVALGGGVRIDGRTLTSGETVLAPACGRPLDITALQRGAKLLVAYPDNKPTAIWRHTPGPDPAAGILPKPEPAHPPLEAALPFKPAMAA
jgi:hypothetical protein